MNDLEKDRFENEINEVKDKIKGLQDLAWVLVWVGILIFICGIFYWFVDKSQFNEVGDFIGGVAGSLWALAGLFFIYIAFLGQKIEIKYQQEDLALTRKELTESREVFKKQADIMSNQQIDNTFFNLLDNHRKIVNSFGVQRKEGGMLKTISGYESLEEISKKLIYYFDLYAKTLKEKRVLDGDVFDNKPSLLIERYGDVKILHDEVMHLIDFINLKVPKKERLFYYKTLAYNLGFAEKFLVDSYSFFQKKAHNLFSFNEFDDVKYSNLNLNIERLKITLEDKPIQFEKYIIEYPIIKFEGLFVKFKRAFISDSIIIIKDLKPTDIDVNQIDLFNSFETKGYDVFKLIKNRLNAEFHYSNNITFEFEMEGLLYYLNLELKLHSLSLGNDSYSLEPTYFYNDGLKKIILAKPI